MLHQRWHQTFTRCVSKVIKYQRISFDIDLRGQLAVAVRCHKEVNVGWAVTVATQFIEQTLCRSSRWATVPLRNDALALVATLVIGNDGAAHVESFLLTCGVEVRVKPLGVGMPDLHLGTRQRLAVSAANRAMHDQRLACLVAAIVQARKALLYGRASHVQRAFNGSRCAIFQSQRLVLGIHAHIEETVKSQSRREQTCLAAGTEPVQIRYTRPVLV